jgi:hypothetical protein
LAFRIEVTAAVRAAIARGAISFDAVSAARAGLGSTLRPKPPLQIETRKQQGDRFLLRPADAISLLMHPTAREAAEISNRAGPIVSHVFTSRGSDRRREFAKRRRVPSKEWSRCPMMATDT